MKTPATPLPWYLWVKAPMAIYGGPTPGHHRAIGRCEKKEDREYIKHAANAYPKLVNAVLDLLPLMHPDCVGGQVWDDAQALLRELGEMK